MAPKTYTSGQAGIALGISSYKIRVLCEAGAIDAELTASGRWKIPEREVRRLMKHGIPEIQPPEPSQSDDDDEETTSSNGGSPDFAPGFGPYPPVSKTTIASKERVLRLKNRVEEKELQRQLRNADRADREQEQQRAQARRREKWLQRWLDHARSRVRKGSGVLSEIHARVDAALTTLRTDDPRTGDVVDDVVQAVLRPYELEQERERAATKLQEERERAIKHAMFRLDFRARRTNLAAEARLRASDAAKGLDNFPDMLAAAGKAIDEINRVVKHQGRIESQLRYIQLPSGASSEDRDQAAELAGPALAALPISATETQMRNAVNHAVRPIVAQIETREAKKERERQSVAHQRQIDLIVNRASLPWGATDEEKQTAERQMRSALELFPAGVDYSRMEAKKREVLAPIEVRVRARTEAESRADRHLSHVDTYLKALGEEGTIVFDGYWDRMNLENKVHAKIRPMVIAELCKSPNISDKRLRELIEDLVDVHYMEYCE